MKEEQKEHLINIMKADEEIGLYDIFNEEKKQGVKDLIDAHKQGTLEEASWKYNPLKKLDGEFLRHAFKEGAKWQAERMYSEKDLEKAFKIGFTIGYSNDVRIDERDKSFNRWFEQFKNK
jgi:hypothetical protein